MNGTTRINDNLSFVEKAVYTPRSMSISNLRVEAEGLEYDACQFELNDLKIIGRSAKITPKKNGQFVTYWKRNADGETEPFSENDKFDFYVINVKIEGRFGQFVFPKSVLINKGIVRTERKDGKRGFRVYPVWDEPQSKQALKTQQWQLDYFFEIGNGNNLEKAVELYRKETN